MSIVLDYGHGGRDVGASYKGRNESEDVERFGKMLAAALRKRGVTVHETREGKAFVSLRARVRYSNEKKPLYFISIHRNASAKHRACGAETYIFPNSPARLLAQQLQDAMVISGFSNRGVKQAAYYVLKHTEVPAILVEIGFIDCARDNARFDEQMPVLTERMACDIARACNK
ncbi:N-acetylmuramoyl-L-alanine amidase family protein [Kurthia senegalensis]|uniref:N-acetylmuramoyl-L-alanine amidase family protein n=1 Tax=Kurthia senegalensis TaxID=1033740 RepID=UPI000287EF0C|nr:N-acetylmuramoyl-L-alanine amidase [Kurthia senegalensis]